MTVTSSELAALFAEPAEAGRRAVQARAAHVGRRVFVRGAPAHPAPPVALTIREPGPEVLSVAPGPAEHVPPDSNPGWPDPASWRAGDRVVVQVDRARAAAYFEWLLQVAAAAPAGTSLAPYCAQAGGLFRLHLLAAARVALPGTIRVEARHDLLGIRLAQVALGFGADTLAGPLAPSRRLPLAGVSRPDETNAAALVTLVEQAGHEPVLVGISPESPA